MGLTEVLTALAVLDGVAGVAAVRIGHRRSGAGPVILALMGAGAVVASFLAELVIWRAVTGHMLWSFSAIHAVYLIATVSIPLVGAALASMVIDKRLPRSAGALALVALLPAPVGFYATHVAPYQLVVERAELALPTGRSGDDPVRVGVLADIQTSGVGDHERAAVERVLALDPDVILIAGDFYQGPEGRRIEEEAELALLLGRLEAPGGVYAVRGDADPEHGPMGELEGTGIRLLDDEVVRVRVNDRSLVIGGTRLNWRSEAARAVYDELGDVGTDEVAILLSHRPDAVLELPADGRIDLTVAGHTHGGQVTLPLVGPLITLTEVPRQVGAGGLHEIAGNAVYVSSGVGMERGHAPQIRFLTPPSVGLVELG